MREVEEGKLGGGRELGADVCELVRGIAVKDSCCRIVA